MAGKEPAPQAVQLAEPATLVYWPGGHSAHAAAPAPDQVPALQLEQLTQVDEDNCRRGLVVTRGPAWDWGDQDGGQGGVGVVLREFYVDNPYKQTDKHLAEEEEEDDMNVHTFDAPDKLCLVQVRWASASVQTYRIGTYGNNWKSIDDSQEASTLLNDLPSVDHEVLKTKLVSKDVTFIMKRDIPGEGQSVLYFLSRTANNVQYFIELKLKQGMNVCKVTVKCASKVYAEFGRVAVAKILSTQ